MLLGASLPASARWRSRVPGAALAAGVLAVVLLSGAPANAHDTLVGSDPADGAVLAAPPVQVVLTFSAAPAAVGAEVLVQGADGASWSAGPATVDGVTVTQALAPGAPAGAYTVTWRAVAADGHPVTGTLGYSVTAPAVSPTPTATPTATPSADPTATPSPSVAAPTPSATPASTDDPTGRAAWPWLLAGVVVVAAAGAAVVRRRGVGHD